MTELFMFLSIQKGHVLYKNGKVTKRVKFMDI